MNRVIKIVAIITGLLLIILAFILTTYSPSENSDVVLQVPAESRVLLLGHNRIKDSIEFREYSLDNGDLITKKILKTEHALSFENFGKEKTPVIQLDEVTGDIFYISAPEYTTGEDWECFEILPDGSCYPAALYKNNIFNPTDDVLLYRPESYQTSFPWLYDAIHKKIYIAESSSAEVKYYRLDIDTKKLEYIDSLPVEGYNTHLGLDIVDNMIVHPYYHYPNKVMKFNFISLDTVDNPKPTYFEGVDIFSHWSADFKKIISNDSSTSFKLTEAESGHVKTISTEQGSFVANANAFWGNNDQEIIFTTRTEQSNGNILYKTYKVDVNSGKQEEMLGSTQEHYFHLLDASPSGKYLMFKTSINSNDDQFYIFDIDNQSMLLLQDQLPEEDDEDLRFFNSNVVWEV